MNLTSILEKVNKKEYLIVIAIGLFVIYGYIGYNMLNIEEHRETILKDIPRTSAIFDIVKINVLQANEFDIALSDGRRIRGKLPLSITPDAKERIIFLLNNSNHPQANLIEKNDDIWTIDIILQKDDNKFFLTEWLVARKFVYNY